MKTDTLLWHGGRLHEAAQQYGIFYDDWLDLSTGINPHAWPVPVIPAATWTRLPEETDGLGLAAQRYYGVESLLAVAGSQAAIQALPILRPTCRVGMLTPAYAEHAQAWEKAGHQVIPLSSGAIEQALPHLDVLLLVHPNNPTGETFNTKNLRAWHQRLARRGGWLIVDEAFMDSTPQHSLAPDSAKKGLIILRSLGKFFGLAGARVGFVLAHETLLNALNVHLGPWCLSGPSRWLSTQALNDRTWQISTRKQLPKNSLRLHALLTQYGLSPTGGCCLFQWCQTPLASLWHEHLAQRGILTRVFNAPASLRFALPRYEKDWQRLEEGLIKLRK